MVMRTDEVKAALERALVLADFISDDGDTLPEDVDGLLAVLAKTEMMARAVCDDVKALVAEDEARQAETNKLAADRYAEQQRADKATELAAAWERYARADRDGHIFVRAQWCRTLNSLGVDTKDLFGDP